MYLYPRAIDFMNEKLLEKSCLVVVFLVCLMVMSTNAPDPDLWGHVQYGRDWIRDGALPITNTYSFTAEGYRWINHENIPELAMAWTVDNLGVGGLIALRALMATAVIGTILIYNLRSGFGFLVSSVVTLLVAWNLGFHFSYRPQVATIVGFTALMLVVQLAFRGWRDRWHVPRIPGLQNWIAQDTVDCETETRDLGFDRKAGRLLWLVPLVMCIWANSHGGFLAGLAIFVAYLGLRAIETMLVRGRMCWGMIRRLSLMAAAAAAAVLLNPYSWNLVTWTIQSVVNPRPEISDWSASHLLSLTGVKFWVLLGVVIFSVAFSRRQKDFTQLVIWSLVIWQSMSHFRHVQFFAVLCGFWLAPHFASALQRFGTTISDTPRSPSNPRVTPIWHLGAVVSVAVVLIISLIPRLRDIQVDRQEYPVDAIQFMADRNLTGKTVVSFDWAQYFIVAMCAPESPLGTGSTVGFDGRYDTCYPQEIIDMHFDFLLGENVTRFRSKNSPPCDPTRVLRTGNPEIVLNRRSDEQSEQIMRQQSDSWTLLYQDTIAQVWGRTDLFGTVGAPQFVAPGNRSIDRNQPVGYSCWPAVPVSKPKLVRQVQTADASGLEPQSRSN